MKIRPWDIGNIRGDGYIQLKLLENTDDEFFWLEATIVGVGFESKIQFADDGSLYPEEMGSGWYMPHWTDFVQGINGIIKGTKNKAILTNRNCREDFSLVFEKDRGGVKVTLKYAGVESWTSLTHEIYLDNLAFKKTTLSFLSAIKSWGWMLGVFSATKGFEDFRNRLKDFDQMMVG